MNSMNGWLERHVRSPMLEIVSYPLVGMWYASDLTLIKKKVVIGGKESFEHKGANVGRQKISSDFLRNLASYWAE